MVIKDSRGKIIKGPVLKKNKSNILFIVILVFICFFSCRERYTVPSIEMIETIATLDNASYNGRIVTEETREEIKNILVQYEEDIKTFVEQKENLGLIYKQIALKYLEIDALKQEIYSLLTAGQYETFTGTEREQTVYLQTMALRFMDSKMFRDALYYLQRAIEILPENELLFFYAGTCSARIGKSILEDSRNQEKYDWLLKSERYYKRAIEIYPYYSDALYAISVLYVYELNLPGEAEEYLLTLKQSEQANTDARFLLANVYYMTGNFENAILEYNDILRITNNEDIKRQATENKNLITNIMEDQYE